MQQPHMAAQVMSNHPDLQDNMGQIQATGASSSPVASGKASNPQGLAEPLVNDAKEHPAPAPAPQSMQRLAGHEGPKAVVLQESASPASAFGGKEKDLPDAFAVQEQHISSGELQGMVTAAEGPGRAPPTAAGGVLEGPASSSGSEYSAVVDLEESLRGDGEKVGSRRDTFLNSEEVQANVLAPTLLSADGPALMKQVQFLMHQVQTVMRDQDTMRREHAAEKAELTAAAQRSQQQLTAILNQARPGAEQPPGSPDAAGLAEGVRKRLSPAAGPVSPTVSCLSTNDGHSSGSGWASAGGAEGLFPSASSTIDRAAQMRERETSQARVAVWTTEAAAAAQAQAQAAAEAAAADRAAAKAAAEEAAAAAQAEAAAEAAAADRAAARVVAGEAAHAQAADRAQAGEEYQLEISERVEDGRIFVVAASNMSGLLTGLAHGVEKPI